MLLLAIVAGCTDGSPGPETCTGDPVERWIDADGDGYGAGEAEEVCADAAGYADVPLDCDDADSAVHPEVEEQCNGLDDDCNGQRDDGLDGVLFYTDADGDGFGVQYPAQLSCSTPGEGWVKNAADCNDTSADVRPNAAEICNGGIDDDCNGVADDNDADVDPASRPTWYRDVDLDGFGDPDVTMTRCLPQATWVADGTDCNDLDERVSPAADEIPGDDIDENCNFLEGCYDDLDDDDARTENWAEVADRYCVQPTHAPVSFPLDCDDTDPTLTVDVGWYVDEDGDGYGGGNAQVFQCTNPGGGLVPQTDVLDCDDEDPDHGPQTPEICDDLIDQNCDLRADCDDPTCSSFCLLPCADIALEEGEVTAQGTTVGRGDDSTPNCVGSMAPDVAFQWVAPFDGLFTFDTQGSNYDTSLYVRNGCVMNDLACNDDFFGVQSMVQVQATAGDVLVIIVDGFSNASGNFVLNIY